MHGTIKRKRIKMIISIMPKEREDSHTPVYQMNHSNVQAVKSSFNLLYKHRYINIWANQSFMAKYTVQFRCSLWFQKEVDLPYKKILAFLICTLLL